MYKPYPNCARWQARPYTPEWRQFSTKWPYSEPLHFLEYLDEENISYGLTNLANADSSCVYPISISFFDFSINWRELIPKVVFEKNILIWFLYSEGDNPHKIKQHLDQQLAGSKYHFTSANSAADNLENFSYFADDELLYRLRNQVTPVNYHEQPRKHKFTALVRTHKWWRATSMARLWEKGLHKQGYFSYNTQLDVGEVETDNPIEIDGFAGLRQITHKFLANGPFTADEYDSDYHNLYHNTVEQHYKDSYLNLILETHLDADQSDGTFLTEKTFKPIKNSQLFIMLGPPGSIRQLKQMGYKTFDTWIDHSYDNIQDNTQRWNAAMKEFESLCNSDLHRIYTDCTASIEHNQRLFLQSKIQRLNTLMEKVNT